MNPYRPPIDEDDVLDELRPVLYAMGIVCFLCAIVLTCRLLWRILT